MYSKYICFENQYHNYCKKSKDLEQSAQADVKKDEKSF